MFKCTDSISIMIYIGLYNASPAPLNDHVKRNMGSLSRSKIRGVLYYYYIKLLLIRIDDDANFLNKHNYIY